jgi:hypothetical protein
VNAVHAVNREVLSIARRIVYLVAGFLGGVIVSRNAAAMPKPSANAALVGAGILCLVGWVAGRREKNSAVAVAVAHAEATATAAAESQAAAFAQAAVHLHLGGEGGSRLIEASTSERTLGRAAAREAVESGRGWFDVPLLPVPDLMRVPAGSQLPRHPGEAAL